MGLADPAPTDPVRTATSATSIEANNSSTVFDRLRSEINLGVAEFTDAHTLAAQRAYLRYGKGRHLAGLTFGDCMSYAAAELAGDPLLAIGLASQRPTSSSATESSDTGRDTVDRLRP